MVVVTAGAKNKTLVRGKRLEDPSLFPVILTQNEFGWKLSVGFDYEAYHFTLAINHLAFPQHPYQA